MRRTGFTTPRHARFTPNNGRGRWQPKLTSSGRGRRPHSRRILDDRVYKEGLLTDDKLCGSFSVYIQEAEANQEIKDYLKGEC